MALDQSSDSPKTRSCGLVIAIAVVILLAVGYTVFRTVTVPKPQSSKTTQPIK